MWMKLQNCAFNIDVKSAFAFWDPIIILLGVTACQRGAGIKKQPVFIQTYFKNYSFVSYVMLFVFIFWFDNNAGLWIFAYFRIALSTMIK